MDNIILNGVLLDEQAELSLNDLCHACSCPAEWIIELVKEGALEPLDLKPIKHQQTLWRFSGYSLKRARIAMRLQRDLDINLSGIALALDLLDEIETLGARLHRIEMRDDS